MILRILLYSIINFIVCQVVAASGLESALDLFSGYEFGQSKKVLHDARMTAFRGTNNEQVRFENEQLLLTFIQSDASLAARREACYWLSEIGTDASRPILEKLAHQTDFADVAQIALDALHGQKRATPNIPTNALAAFKAEVLVADNQVYLLRKALLGTDEEKARLAFKMIKEGVATKPACAWLGRNIQKLSEPRQIIAMNLLLQVEAPETAAVITHLSRGGEETVRRTAIRLLGVLGSKEDMGYLTKLWLGADANSAEAAQLALQSMPDGVVRKVLLEKLKSTDFAVQAKAIQMVELRGASLAADSLSLIANQRNNPNQKAAIRAMGKTAAPSTFQEILEQYVASEGSAIENDLKMAAWDLARRQPDYDKALMAIEQQSTTSSDKMKASLIAMEKRLEGMKPKVPLGEILK